MDVFCSSIVPSQSSTAFENDSRVRVIGSTVYLLVSTYIQFRYVWPVYVYAVCVRTGSLFDEKRSPNYYTLEKMARRSLGCQRKYSNGLTAVVRLRIFAQRKGFCSIRSVYEVLPPPSRFFQRKEKHKTQHTSQHDIHNTTKPKHTIIVYHS
jgi:hypothetical protein